MNPEMLQGGVFFIIYAHLAMWKGKYIFVHDGR